MEVVVDNELQVVRFSLDEPVPRLDLEKLALDNFPRLDLQDGAG